MVLRGRRAGTRSEPELGAAAAAVNVDGGGANPLDGETREGGGGGGGGGQELQQQQVDPAPSRREAPSCTEKVAPRPRRVHAVAATGAGDVFPSLSLSRLV